MARTRALPGCLADRATWPPVVPSFVVRRYYDIDLNVLAGLNAAIRAGRATLPAVSNFAVRKALSLRRQACSSRRVGYRK